MLEQNEKSNFSLVNKTKTNNLETNNERIFGIQREDYYHDHRVSLKKEYDELNQSSKEKCFEKNNMNQSNIFKKNFKNTYIRKINDLIFDKNKQVSSENFLKESQSSLNFNEICNGNKIKSNNSFTFFENKEKKLEKNRESARNSRKRKKIYIEMLENKVKLLKEQLKKNKSLLEENKLNKTKFHQSKNQEISINQKNLILQIEKELNKNASESVIIEILGKYNFINEIDCNNKFYSIQFFFEQILEIMIPLHMRYLMIAAYNKTDIFQDDAFINSNHKINFSKQNDGILLNLDLAEKNKKEILKHKKRLFIEKEKFGGLIIQSVVDWQKKLKIHTYSVKEIIEEMRNTLDLKQLSCFHINLEKVQEKNNSLLQKLMGWDKVRGHNDENNNKFEEFKFDFEEIQKFETTKKKIHR